MTRNKKTMPEGMAKRFDPEGETGDESNRRENAARMSGGRFGLAIGAAQDCPIDIGAQVFAANGAIGDALNIRTAISRNWPMTTKPLTRKRRMHTQGFSQGSATAKNGNRLLYGCYMFAHKANSSDAI
jgi:hypothetical protein